MMKRIKRERRLTAEEAATYRQIREQVAAELPELIERHHRRIEESVVMHRANPEARRGDSEPSTAEPP